MWARDYSFKLHCFHNVRPSVTLSLDDCEQLSRSTPDSHLKLYSFTFTYQFHTPCKPMHILKCILWIIKVCSSVRHNLSVGFHILLAVAATTLNVLAANACQNDRWTNLFEIRISLKLPKVSNERSEVYPEYHSGPLKFEKYLIYDVCSVCTDR